MCARYLGSVGDSMSFPPRLDQSRAGYRFNWKKRPSGAEFDAALSELLNSAVVEYAGNVYGVSEENTPRSHLANGQPFSFSTLSHESDESIQTAKTRPSSPVVSSLFSCIECSRHFKTDAELWAHAKKEMHRPIACICGERFSGTYELDRHIRAQADKWWDTSHHARRLPRVPLTQPLKKHGVIGPIWELTEYDTASEEHEEPREQEADIKVEVPEETLMPDSSHEDDPDIGGLEDDSTEPDSPFVSDSSDERDKNSGLEDRADLELATLIHSLTVERTSAGSGKESSSRSKPTLTTSSEAASSGLLSYGSHPPRRKRGRVQKNNGGSDDEGFLQPPSRKRTPSNRGGRQRSLACPFAKNDPRKHHACFSKKLSRIRDVKQHLARKHTPEFYCFRCSAIFPDHDGLEAHVGNVAGLFCTPSSLLDGVSRQQHLRLSRKSNSRHSEEEQWFSIWDVLFPGSERPGSAYVEFGFSEDLCSYREYSHDRAVAAVVEGLQASGFVAAEVQNTMMEEVRRVVADRLDSVFEQWWANPLSSTTPFSDTSSSNRQRGSAASTRQLTPASSEDSGGGQEMASEFQPAYHPSVDAEVIANQQEDNEDTLHIDLGLRSDSSTYPQDTDQSVLSMADHFDFEAWMADQTQDTVMLSLDTSHNFDGPSFTQYGESGD
ncbi:hypothetical protein GGS26DRAFT_553858 [Hypomontagnella submonticulosa]|nr:hypothetical protein GGS26DRAFT_553858 [Hypomontagnella submonticulosa]